MKCPTCLQNTVPDRWTAFITEDPIEREEAERMAAIYGGQIRSQPKEQLVAADQATYTLDWSDAATRIASS